MTEAEIRAEWKGPWQCEKCGKIGSWTWAEMVRDLGHHYASDIVPECRGKLVPHDRRASDPEKQELVEALREAAQSLEYIAGEAGHGELLTDFLQIRGYAHNRAKCACALLRRYEEEKP